MKVLLAGWDAADWKVIRPLMEAGKMPHVRRLVEGGVSGQIATLHPPLSPMLWTSIATGKRPFQHGIHGFSEPTLDGRGIQPVSNLSRSAKALWNILSQSGLSSTIVGWWPSHPAEPIQGAMVSDHFHRAHAPLEAPWPMPANAVHPPELAGRIARLRVHPEQLAPEVVEEFIPLAREIDQGKDKRLGGLLRTLAESLSVQAAAVWLAENRPCDLLAVYFDSIDHYSHLFMKYHPPRQDWIGERDFELYSGVIARAYQHHDRMLGELMHAAGDDATVILASDHGFHPDHLRPAEIPDIPAGPAVEHREYGVVAMAGAGIKKNAALRGASVLDVAPTVLTLFGLPVGEDMDGKVLVQAFAQEPHVKYVPSWEEIDGADGRHPVHTRLDPVAAAESLERMIALGYIERPGEDREGAVRKTIQELRYNLAESYQDAARHTEARQILAELHAAEAGDARFASRLFVSCQALGLIGEMRAIADETPEPALVAYMKAQVAAEEGRFEEAAAGLQHHPAALAEVYLRMKRWDDAEQAWRTVLKRDPDHARAHLGLCQVALRRRKYDAAVGAALEAVERTHQDPQAHYFLGLALNGRKDYARAAEAFRAAISINPNYAEAHARLAGLDQAFAGRVRQPGISVKPETQGASAEEEQCESDGRAGIENAVIIVTGLPRSGTSMMMQMLAAGGVEVLHDGVRTADASNPRGYFEYEPVKRLLQDSAWLREARGKAVKIVAPLLSALPPGLPCNVIVCERDLERVLDSQERMLAGTTGKSRVPVSNREALRKEFARLMARSLAMLRKRPLTCLLRIAHQDVIGDPAGVAARIHAFLKGAMDEAKMAGAVDPALIRRQTTCSKPGLG